MIELNNLTFGFDKNKLILDDLNLKVSEGERIGIVGFNGSGKTTVLHLIMGLLKPDSGTVKVFDKICENEKDFSEVRKRVGLLFQNPEDQLFLPTVAEDIAFGPLNLGHSKDETIKIINETCEILGLEGFQERTSYKLSWGEKRLVSLATVISMKPEILLLDEPTLGLDFEITEKIIDYLNKEAKSYIIISHDDYFLKKTVDKVYQIKGKRLK